MNDRNENKSKVNNNLYNELSIIINQQSILSQKVGILFAINTIIISSIITLAINIKNYWIILAIIPWLISIIINVRILFPNFKSSDNSKYFYDFPEMKIEEIAKTINDEQNTLDQIKVNSTILKKKYVSYKHSLAISFLLFPYLFLIKFKWKN